MTLADHDAERSVLASVLLHRADVQAATYARLAGVVRAEHFDDARHAAMWEAMGAIVTAGRPVDSVTLTAALRAMKREHAVGGIAYFREVARSMAQDVTFTEAHAERVLVLAQRRIALAAADAHRARLLAGDDVSASVARMERESRDGIAAQMDLTARAAMADAWGEFDDETGRSARYGVAALDGSEFVQPVLGGLFAGQLTGLGGVPGGGKTAMAITAAVATAEAGGRVLFGALEMPRTDVAWRIAAGYCQWSPPSVDRIRSRKLSGDEITDLQRASRAVADLPLVVDDRPTTADAFCALARAEHSRDPLSLVVVDYLHLFERDAVDAKSREDQVIRRQVYALKTLAKALRVPVLMLVQFNRGGAKSERPTMFDAFGGSGIEHGCDNVVILVPDASTKGASVGRVMVYVDKRRGGSPCEDGVPILFDRARQRMRDIDGETSRVEYPRDTSRGAQWDDVLDDGNGAAWAPGGDAE